MFHAQVRRAFDGDAHLFVHWLRSFLPGRTRVNGGERLRACIGALLGIALTGALSHACLGDDPAALWLVAPMGASAVLLFAVPASPLAQPWSLVGGNVVAALIGVGCANYIAAPLPAAALAIALAIAAMFALRCLHPPSGAVALTAVLGGPAVHAAGFGFVLLPVGLNSVLLLLVAMAYNNLTGRRYPHTQQAPHRPSHATADAPPTARLGFTTADLNAVLRNYNQVLDISPDELEAILLQTEMAAHQRRLGERRCSELMSRDVVTVAFSTPLAQAWQLLERHQVHALPVLNPGRRVIGMLTRSDFLRHAGVLEAAQLKERLRTLLRYLPLTHSEKPEVAGQIMQRSVVSVRANQPIVELVPLMSNQGMHQLPVLDEAGKLVGLISQADLVAGLFELGLR
ncbi:MAG: HPP family protein [Pseudomonadota bacterium]